jgi:site-specific recombinase XerD
MTKDFFLQCVKAIWANTDLAHIHSHSFRIGHATELLLAGVPAEMVAALSGWSLLSFLLYWWKIEGVQ